MSAPLLSCVIPTIGRTTLARTLRSIREQSVPAEIVCVFDTHGADEAVVRATGSLAESYGARFLKLDAGRHDTGSPQIALGFQIAKGGWLLNFGDDDEYLPDAFATILSAIRAQDAPHPLMFKVELHPNEARGDMPAPAVLWERQAIERFNVTGQSFVCPRDGRRLGRWVNDWQFMAETVERHGGQIDWRDEVIARCF